MANHAVNEVIKPIIIHMENGETYTLEFNRESVKFAEARGFTIEDAMRFSMTKIPELFFYAFRMHHPKVSREKTDHILFDELGGLPDGAAERLGQLYSLPFEALTQKDDGAEKNARARMEL